MADYTEYSPANLENIDPTVPTSAEDPAKLWEALKQTRAILKAVIQKEHNDDGTHKNVVVPDASITGPKIQSSAVDDSKRAIGTDHIKDKSITVSKMADLSIEGRLIASNSVTDKHLADASIKTNKIAGKQITADKMAERTITELELADNAVVERHIADGSVGGDAIKDKAVDASKMALGALLGMFGGGDGGGVECAIGGNLQLKSIDLSTTPAVANFLIRASEGTILPIAVIKEVGSTGGQPIAQQWNVRPVAGTSQISVRFDPTGMIQGGPKTFRFKDAGSYLVLFAAVGYRVNMHQGRIRNITRDQTITAGLISESDPTTGTQSSSIGFGLAEIVEAGDEFQFQHWTQATAATGLGNAQVSNGEEQTFMLAVFLKLS